MAHEGGFRRISSTLGVKRSPKIGEGEKVGEEAQLADQYLGLGRGTWGNSARGGRGKLKPKMKLLLKKGIKREKK